MNNLSGDKTLVPQWIIEQKRDGQELSSDNLRAFIDAYARDEIPDYQMAAFAMAVFFQGMSFEEVTVMTDAMMRSGDVLDLSDLDRPTVDKHSTGGVGDKISLPLAPLVASAGAAVPMIAGRGLGSTGGTLDKLESVSGFRTSLTVEEFKRVLDDIGCVIIGQTERLAPADRKLYALRDVTGTVPSIPMIASSILSKKLAEGARALVLDVKCGAGAFMRNREQARRLADTMVAIGRNMGRSMSAFVTAMDQPLGRTAGNSLEVRESLEILRNEGPQDVRDLTLELGSEMLVLAGIAATRQEAGELLQEKLRSGEALETFAKMIAAQGGDASVCEKPELLPQAPEIITITAPRRGYAAEVSADTIGRIVLLLGGGRRRTGDLVDPRVGVDDLVKVGEFVESGAPLMRLHVSDRASAGEAEELAKKAVSITVDMPAVTPLVYETLREPDKRDFK